jgi:hypothetical protein
MDAQTALAQSNYANTRTFTLPMAAEVWGLSLPTARKLKLEPDEIKVNYYGRDSARYTRESVIRYYDDERVVRARYRSTGRRDWGRVLEEEYGAPERAMPDAARAMDELYRFARTARDRTRNRVYVLLVPFTRFLYERGHCTEAIRHWPECRLCRGSGCQGCPDQCIGFVFQVGQTYRWRLPASECPWVQKCEDGDWVDNREMPSNVGFAKLYALIEWAMLSPADETN